MLEPGGPRKNPGAPALEQLGLAHTEEIEQLLARRRHQALDDPRAAELVLEELDQ